MNSSDSKNPSQEVNEYWIWSNNLTDMNNTQPGTKCGKWLIFEDVAKIDDTWKKIDEATQNGRLGFRAKVSTMKDKQSRSNQPVSQSVICVYTYDWTDDTDVMRVRKELRNLGFVNKLSYKSDQDTLAGNYSGPGKRVSKYYC